MTRSKPLSTELTQVALDILQAPQPSEKVRLTFAAKAEWDAGQIPHIGTAKVIDRPARPTAPELLPPARMPHRKKGSLEGRISFIHAIAHIELNAVDLAWDLIARFSEWDVPRAFFSDWVETAADEARHFQSLADRLVALGSHYGAMPAHDGLWEAAENTRDDLSARLAIVPMVLEARGLDTTPPAVSRLRNAGDHESAALLETIGEEEIPHVAAGVRWFTYLCEKNGKMPTAAFHDIVRSRFCAKLRPPFNEKARSAAGMHSEFYLPLAA